MRRVKQDDTAYVWSLETSAIPDSITKMIGRLLAPWEQEKAWRFRHKADCRDYLWAHLLRRLLLSHCFGGTLNQWEFGISPLGKPLISGKVADLQPHCNITHTHGFVAAAVTLGNTVGIDAEARDRFLESDIAALICSPDEIAMLSRFPAQQQSERLLHLWVRKEAFTKAIGIGLALKFSEVEISPDGHIWSIDYVDDTGISGRWWVKDMASPSGWLLSVSARHPVWPVHYVHWDENGILHALSRYGAATTWPCEITEISSCCHLE